MRKFFTLMLSLLALVTAIPAAAETVTATFGNNNVPIGTSSPYTATYIVNDDITISFDWGNSKPGSSTDYTPVNQSNTVTFTASEGCLITDLKYGAITGNGAMSADGYDAGVFDATSNIWTGETQVVTYKQPSGKGIRLSTVEITYTKPSAGPVGFEYDFPEAITLEADQEYTIELPEVAPEIVWTSADEDEAVIMLEDNYVIAVGEGSTTITGTWAEDDNFTAGSVTIPVTVVATRDVVNCEFSAPEFALALDKEELPYEVGEISFTALDGEAEDLDLSNFVFTSTDDAVAIFEDGKLILTGFGSATITAALTEAASLLYNYDDDCALTLSVTVEDANPPVLENAAYTWTFTGLENNSAATEKLYSIVKLGDGSAAGTWTASSGEVKCYGQADFGVLHFGSNSTCPEGVTITLSESEIPTNAVIKEITLGVCAPKDYTVEWGAKVNGVEAGNTASYTGDNPVSSSNNSHDVIIKDINLVGNEVGVFLKTVATKGTSGQKKAAYISGVTISYEWLVEPSAPVCENKPEVVKHGDQIVYTVKHGHIEYKIENANMAASMYRSAVTADWTKSTENEGKQFTYTYEAGDDHIISVKNVVNGQEAYADVLRVSDQGTVTGIEDVEAGVAEGARELYTLQGVRVSEAMAVPGVYLERRGGKVAKVVLK